MIATTTSPHKGMNIQISDITVELSTNTNKWIQSIDVRIDGEQVAARWDPKGSAESLRRVTVTMLSPRTMVSSLHLTVHLRYRTFLQHRWRSQEFALDADELASGYLSTKGDRQEWYRAFGKMRFIIGMIPGPIQAEMRRESSGESYDLGREAPGSPGVLRPTTDEILAICPCFRILVIGKTGVGKSQLINRTFGVTDALVSHSDAGDADINKEIPSRENPHFLLHDSKGFEHGDDANVKTVQQFINDRSKRPLVKDKLHAVWLCMDIPVAGGRLLESGIEQFLQLKIQGKLGNVPVIGVFTKYDLLALRAERMMPPTVREGLKPEDLARVVEQNANDQLERTCVKPFERWVDGKVPHVTVSTKSGYEYTLSDLVQLTYDHVGDYFAEASVVSAMAQRVNPRVNIQASIAVGRRKYWERLASSVNFSGKTLLECLDVIHADIVAVWQFDDPNGYLSSLPFKSLMSNIVVDKSSKRGPDTAQPSKTMAAGISMLAGIAGIVSALSGPAAPIVVPIAAGFVLGKWVYDVYQKTNLVLERLMTYIIDLTLILQNLFWLQSLTNEGRPISRRLIKAAVRAYSESNAKQSLRFQIDRHLRESISFNVGPDTTIDKIIELIDCYTIDSAEMLRHSGNLSIGHVSGAEEEWDTRDG